MKISFAHVWGIDSVHLKTVPRGACRWWLSIFLMRFSRLCAVSQKFLRKKPLCALKRPDFFSVVFHVDSCSENSSGGSDRHAPEIRWGKDMKLFAQSRLEAPMNTKSLLLGWRLQSKGRKRMTLCCYSVVVWIKADWARWAWQPVDNRD